MKGSKEGEKSRCSLDLPSLLHFLSTRFPLLFTFYSTSLRFQLATLAKIEEERDSEGEREKENAWFIGQGREEDRETGRTNEERRRAPGGNSGPGCSVLVPLFRLLLSLPSSLAYVCRK